MELGDHNTAEREKRTVLDVALNAFDSALNGVIEIVEASGLDQLTAHQKVALWMTSG